MRDVPSLQAKHSRQCALDRPWTPFKGTTKGCSCPQGPVYYVVVRQGRKAIKHRVGRNRKDAERALRRMAVEVDAGAYEAQRNIGFSTWADQWIKSLERMQTTIDSYAGSMKYANRVFCQKPVRRLGPDDVIELNVFLREKGSSPSSRARHLRVLGACLQAAVRHGYASTNAVRLLSPGQKPRPSEKRRPTWKTENWRRSSRRSTTACTG